MTLFGVDYSGSRPSPVCLARNGVKFAGRYLEPASDWKTLRRPEADALIAAGVAIVGFYETSANRALAGFNAGAADATGVDGRRVLVDMPADRPIYFAVDFDASARELAGPVADYFRGIRTVLPLSQIGGYGGYRTIKFLFDNALIGWGHQTYAWSRDPQTGRIRWDARAHIQQYDNGETFCGGVVDFNRGMFDDIGQWPAPAKPTPPAPHLPSADSKGPIDMVLIMKHGGTPAAGWAGWYSYDGLTRQAIHASTGGMAHAARLVRLGARDAKTGAVVTDTLWDGVSHTTNPADLDRFLGLLAAP